MVNTNISLCNVIMATSEDIDQTRAKCVEKHENINTGIKTKNGQKKSGWFSSHQHRVHFKSTIYILPYNGRCYWNNQIAVLKSENAWPS